MMEHFFKLTLGNVEPVEDPKFDAGVADGFLKNDFLS